MTWEHIHLIMHAFAIVPAVAGTLVGLAGWALSAGLAERAAGHGDRDLEGSPRMQAPDPGRRASAGMALERYGLVSLLIAGVFAVPSYLTGVAAADVISQRTFVQPSVVQTHRTWATWAAVALATSGILAGFALAQPRDRTLRRFVLVTGILTATLVGFAAFLGGRIVHGGA